MSTLEGYLEIFIGPMWSGKTSELVRKYTRLTSCDIPIIKARSITFK